MLLCSFLLIGAGCASDVAIMEEPLLDIERKKDPFELVALSVMSVGDPWYEDENAFETNQHITIKHDDPIKGFYESEDPEDDYYHADQGGIFLYTLEEDLESQENYQTVLETAEYTTHITARGLELKLIEQTVEHGTNLEAFLTTDAGIRHITAYYGNGTLEQDLRHEIDYFLDMLLYKK